MGRKSSKDRKDETKTGGKKKVGEAIGITNSESIGSGSAVPVPKSLITVVPAVQSQVPRQNINTTGGNTISPRNVNAINTTHLIDVQSFGINPVLSGSVTSLVTSNNDEDLVFTEIVEHHQERPGTVTLYGEDTDVGEFMRKRKLLEEEAYRKRDEELGIAQGEHKDVPVRLTVPVPYTKTTSKGNPPSGTGNANVNDPGTADSSTNFAAGDSASRQGSKSHSNNFTNTSVANLLDTGGRFFANNFGVVPSAVSNLSADHYAANESFETPRQTMNHFFGLGLVTQDTGADKNSIDFDPDISLPLHASKFQDALTTKNTEQQKNTFEAIVKPLDIAGILMQSDYNSRAPSRIGSKKIDQGQLLALRLGKDGKVGNDVPQRLGSKKIDQGQLLALRLGKDGKVGNDVPERLGSKKIDQAQLLALRLGQDGHVGDDVPQRLGSKKIDQAQLLALRVPKLEESLPVPPRVVAAPKTHGLLEPPGLRVGGAPVAAVRVVDGKTHSAAFPTFGVTQTNQSLNREASFLRQESEEILLDDYLDDGQLLPKSRQISKASVNPDIFNESTSSNYSRPVFTPRAPVLRPSPEPAVTPTQYSLAPAAQKFSVPEYTPSKAKQPASAAAPVGSGALFSTGTTAAAAPTTPRTLPNKYDLKQPVPPVVTKILLRDDDNPWRSELVTVPFAVKYSFQPIKTTKNTMFSVPDKLNQTRLTPPAKIDYEAAAVVNSELLGKQKDALLSSSKKARAKSPVADLKFKIDSVTLPTVSLEDHLLLSYPGFGSSHGHVEKRSYSVHPAAKHSSRTIATSNRYRSHSTTVRRDGRSTTRTTQIAPDPYVESHIENARKVLKVEKSPTPSLGRSITPLYDDRKVVPDVKTLPAFQTGNIPSVRNDALSASANFPSRVYSLQSGNYFPSTVIPLEPLLSPLLSSPLPEILVDEHKSSSPNVFVDKIGVNDAAVSADAVESGPEMILQESNTTIAFSENKVEPPTKLAAIAAKEVQEREQRLAKEAALAKEIANGTFLKKPALEFHPTGPQVRDKKMNAFVFTPRVVHRGALEGSTLKSYYIKDYNDHTGGFNPKLETRVKLEDVTLKNLDIKLETPELLHAEWGEAVRRNREKAGGKVKTSREMAAQHGLRIASLGTREDDGNEPVRSVSVSPPRLFRQVAQQDHDTSKGTTDAAGISFTAHKSKMMTAPPGIAINDLKAGKIGSKTTKIEKISFRSSKYHFEFPDAMKTSVSLAEAAKKDPKNPLRRSWKMSDTKTKLEKNKKSDSSATGNNGAQILGNATEADSRAQTFRENLKTANLEQLKNSDILGQEVLEKTSVRDSSAKSRGAGKNKKSSPDNTANKAVRDAMANKNNNTITDELALTESTVVPMSKRVDADGNSKNEAKNMIIAPVLGVGPMKPMAAQTSREDENMITSFTNANAPVKKRVSDNSRYEFLNEHMQNNAKNNDDETADPASAPVTPAAPPPVVVATTAGSASGTGKSPLLTRQQNADQLNNNSSHASHVQQPDSKKTPYDNSRTNSPTIMSTSPSNIPEHGMSGAKRNRSLSGSRSKLNFSPSRSFSSFEGGALGTNERQNPLETTSGTSSSDNLDHGDRNYVNYFLDTPRKLTLPATHARISFLDNFGRNLLAEQEKLLQHERNVSKYHSKTMVDNTSFSSGSTREAAKQHSSMQSGTAAGTAGVIAGAGAAIDGNPLGILVPFGNVLGKPGTPSPLHKSNDQQQRTLFTITTVRKPAILLPEQKLQEFNSRVKDAGKNAMGGLSSFNYNLRRS